MSTSRTIGFRQRPWVVFFLLTVPIWSIFPYGLLLRFLNLITTMFFGVPLEKLLPGEGCIFLNYWLLLHLPLWGALFFVKNLSPRLCALLPISWFFVLILMTTNGLMTQGSLEMAFERAASFRVGGTSSGY